MKNKYLFILFVFVAFFGNTKAQTTLLSEGFETSVPPAGWSSINNGSGNNWSQRTDGGGPHTGTYYAGVLYNASFAANA